MYLPSPVHATTNPDMSESKSRMRASYADLVPKMELLQRPLTKHGALQNMHLPAKSGNNKLVTSFKTKMMYVTQQLIYPSIAGALTTFLSVLSVQAIIGNFHHISLHR